MLGIDQVVADAALQSFAVYAVFTGLGSILLAVVNRRRRRLGPWAWTIMLAWAAHIWAIVWVVNIELVTLPHTPVPAGVLIVVGVLFLGAEVAAIEALCRRLHRRD